MSSIGEIAKFRTSIQTNTINEFTSASGVTIDGVLLKDGSITASGTGANTFVGLITCGGTAISDGALSTSVAAKFRSGSATYTDNVTAASGTVTHGTINSFDNPAIAATNGSVTYSNASTLYIDGAPTAGSNVTITNPYALYIADGRIVANHAETVTAGVNAFSKTNSFTLSGDLSTSVGGFIHTTTMNTAGYNATRPFTTGGGGIRNSYFTARALGASGTVTGASAVVAQVDNTSTGTLTNGAAFYAEAAINSGNGTFTDYYAYYAEASTAAGTNYAFYANNAASGTARYNFYANGDAPNLFGGVCTLGKSDNTSVHNLRSPSQATVGAAGGAAAIPATPTGYVEIAIQGTAYVIPYYAKS